MPLLLWWAPDVLVLMAACRERWLRHHKHLAPHVSMATFGSLTEALTSGSVLFQAGTAMARRS
jgi:hypothetical protein